MPIDRTPKNMWQGAIKCIIKTIRHRKDRSVNHFRPSQNVLKYYEENFKLLHRKVKKSGKCPDEKLYDRIILLNSIEKLFLWASHVQTVIEKEAKMPEKKPIGLSKFKFWEKKPAAEVIPEAPPEESYEIIFAEIEAGPLSSLSMLPNDYIKMKFELTLGSGIFKLIKPTSTGEDCLIFTYNTLQTSVAFKVKGLEAYLSMQDLSLSTCANGEFSTIVKKVSSDGTLWILDFKAKPNDLLSWSLDSVFESLEINYNPAFLALVMSFFVVPKTRDSVKNAAWDTIKGIQDSTSEALNDLLQGETFFSIRILCSAPKIKIPSPTQQGLFFLNLGDIEVTNTISHDFYEDFRISMSSLGLKYQDITGSLSDIVSDFEISSTLKMLKSKYYHKKSPGQAEVLIEAKLPMITLTSSPSMFHQLQRLPEMFSINSQENIGNNSESKIQGKVKKLTPGIHAWKEFTSTLVGSYLYFYSPEQFGGTSNSFFFIKDCNVLDVSDELQMENCLRLQNVYGECTFALGSKSEFEKWKILLSETINDYESRTSLVAKKAAPESQSVKFKLNFYVSTAVMQLTKENNLGISAKITLNNMQSEVVSKDFEFKFTGAIGGMEICQASIAKFSKLFQSKVSQELILVKIKHIDSKSPNYKNQDFKVKVHCGAVEVDWNYHLVMELMNFFQFAGYSDPSLTIEKQVGVVAKDHVLLNFSIESEEISINLNNNTTGVSIGRVSVQQFASNFTLQSEGNIWRGTLGNIEISDLTNYPATALNNPIVPYKLFTVRENNRLMHFTIIMYSESLVDRDPDTSTKVELELNSINIVYLHQPIMRIIDYLMNHVLGAFDTMNRVNEIDKNSLCKPKVAEQTLSFTSILVKIHEPIVYIPPRPGSAQYFIINLGQITVKNSLLKANNPGWVDSYQIQMKKLHLLSTSNAITEEFNIDLEVTRKLLTAKHLKMPGLDKAYRISGNCEGIKLNLSLRDYTLLIKTSDLNVLYDDQLETYISPLYRLGNVEPGEFLVVDFKIQTISILFTVQTGPIFELFCINQNIASTKFNNGTVKFNLTSMHVLGLIDEASVASKEKEFALMAEKVFSISYDTLTDFFDYSEYFRLNSILCGPISQKQQEILTISLETFLDNSKTISVNLSHIRINFHLSKFYQILSFLTSGLPNYVASPHTPQDYIKKYRPLESMVTKEIIMNYYAPKISATVELKNSIVILPSTKKITTLVACLDLTFVYIREKEGGEGVDVMKRLILENFGILHTKYDDMMNFLTLEQKRKVLEPLQIIYENREFKKKSACIENYIIGSLNCALSYHDLLLIQSSYMFQEEMLTKDSSLLKTLESYSNLQVLENRLLEDSDEFMLPFEITDKTIQFSFAGLNIIIINDALTAYTPVLDVSISLTDKGVTLIEKNHEVNAKGMLSLWLSYYNPISDVWEPFIEPFNLECEIISSLSNNIKTQYVFSVTSEVLNVNCSEIMVKNFQDILKMWDTSLEETQELISPFQIRNELGYSILIQYKYNQEITIVESGNTVDHIIDYYCRDKKLGKSDSIFVSIFPGDFQPEKMRIKTNKVQCVSYTSEHQIVVVDTVLQTTRKTLTIRSALVIVNDTKLLIELLFQKPGKSEARVCLPGNSVPVPYDFIKSSLGLEISGSKSRKIISLDEHWVKYKSHIGEALVGGVFLSLHYKISKTNKNKRTLYLKPPLLIRNCLPSPIGLRIYEGKPSKFDEIIIEKNEEFSTHLYSLHSELAASFSLEHFARSNTFPLLSHNHNSNRVKLIDKKNQELYINIAKFTPGCNMILFYVTQVIVNNTLNPLAFYQRQKGSEKLIAGQNFTNTILPSNATKKIFIGLGNKKSKTFKLDSVGVQDIIELIGDVTPAGNSAKYQYTLDVQLAKVVKSEMILTRIVVISPRFLIVNRSELEILIGQDGLMEFANFVESGKEKAFHWSDKNCKELVRMRPKVGKWAWTGAFSIDSLGAFTVQCKEIDELSSFIMFKVEIKIIATTAHVVFEIEKPKTASFRIQNNSQLFSLAVYQKNNAEDTRFIDTCTISPFTWSNHLSDHEVIVEFIMGPEALTGKDTNSMYIINLDKLNQNLKINIKEAPIDLNVLYVTVQNEGVTRILNFSDMPMQNSKELTDVILSFYSFNIPRLGISLIEHLKHKSKELLYLTATEVVVLVQSTGKEYKAEVIVKELQIDNQMNADAIYPVLMHVAEVSNRKVLHFTMVLCKNSDLQCRNFERFEFLMQTLTVKLDSVCVRKMINLMNRVWLKSDTMDSMFEVLEEFQETTSKLESTSLSQTYYFSFLKVHPIKFLVSFIPIKEENQKNDLLSGIASFGMALTTIESAPVKLFSIQLSDVFASEKRLKESFQSHYKSQLMNEFYSLIGHSNILGNPIGLLNDLGTGVVDFFYEPAQGIINGPISAGEGILKGTSSLIKNTLSGTFGTVSKLTSTITTGLTALTQDKEYMMDRQRDLAKNKPHNIVDGVGLGMLSFIKNVGQGITGIVTEPIKGFKKDKMEGMLIGGFKGLSGLVVKPIAGALDMVSRSAEGIKNTANIFDKNTEYGKQREPRVFYGSSQLIQVYSKNDAELMEFLFKIGKKKYCEKEFIEQIYGQDKDGRTLSLMFFTDLAAYFSVTRKKILWKVVYTGIISYELAENSLWIKKKGEKNKEIVVKVEFKSQNNNVLAEKRLMAVLHLNN